jgi:hypothetical protein
MSLLIALSAALLEALALAAFTGVLAPERALGAYLLPHLLASALLAGFGLRQMPWLAAGSPRAAAALMFSLSAFIPVLGFAGVAAGLWAGRYRHAVRDGLGLRRLHLPPLDARRPVTRPPGARIGGVLANPHVPTARRLQALAALQHVPGRVASPLLRELLEDDSEDLRLLAYGMLDRKEKALNAAIHAARQRLHSATTPLARALAHTQLAGQYWELIYQGLARGELREHAARTGLAHAEAALALRPAGGGLHLRRGQFLLALARGEAAREAFETARQHGIPDHRVLPQLAELAFQARDFAAVRAALAPLASWPGSTRLTRVLQLWARP